MTAPFQQPPAYQPPHQPEQPAPPAQSGQAAQPGQPGRQQVHHSYIWLGGIQVAITVFIVGSISLFSTIAGVVIGGELSPNGFLTLPLALGLGVLFLLAIVGITVLLRWFAYRYLYYELTPNEFNLYSGVFTKRRVHVPYQRIQSVDQNASLLQRIFGVCTVKIDTAGGSANKAVTVPFVQKAQAEELRRELFARKQYAVAVESGVPADAAAAAVAAAASAAGQPAAAFPAAAPGASTATVPGAQGYPAPGAPSDPLGTDGNVLDAPAELWQDMRGVFAGSFIDTGRVTYEYGMSNKELVFTGLSNGTAFILVAVGLLAGSAQLAGQLAPIFFGLEETQVGHMVVSSAQAHSGSVIALGVALFMGIAVILWALTALGTCISYGGFKARRRDTRIEVEHGLLQHRFQGVDIDRVQSVSINQTFIRRLMGYCELSLGKIDAASGSDEQQQSAQGMVVHPFVKMDRVPEIMAGLLPEFADVPTDQTPVAPQALRRAVLRRGIWQGFGFWLAVCVAVTQIVLSTVLPSSEAWMQPYINSGAFVAYAVCLVLFVLEVASAVMWARGSGFAYNRRFMQVTNGGFSRHTVSFPRAKIQYGYTRANPFQRRAHTATLNARTAAGVGGTTTRLIDVCEDDATAWLIWVKPGGNMVQ